MGKHLRGLCHRDTLAVSLQPLMAQRVNLFLDDDFAEIIRAQKPRSLSLSSFCALLVEKGLDASGTLGLASGSEASTSNSYIPKSKNISKTNKNKGRKQGEPTIYPDDFTAFWKAYQSLPVKAGKQSKPLALQAWKEATAATDPAALLTAIQKQIEVQQSELRTERGFTVSMPDCFRWLRDECFHALLEENSPAVNDKPSWML